MTTTAMTRYFLLSLLALSASGVFGPAAYAIQFRQSTSDHPSSSVAHHHGLRSSAALLEEKARVGSTLKAGFRAEVEEAGMSIGQMVDSDDEDDEENRDEEDKNSEDGDIEEDNDAGGPSNDEGDEDDEDDEDDDEVKVDEEDKAAQRASLLAQARRQVRTSDGIRFEPEVWNQDWFLQSSHNCFMYALNDIYEDVRASCEETMSKFHKKSGSTYRKSCRRHFHKPGYYFQNKLVGLAATDAWHRKSTTCNYLMPLIFSDSPVSIWRESDGGAAPKRLTEYDQCPENHYMAALVIDRQKGFHFYRRDHDCKDERNAGKTCWSHKPGIMKATDKDASGDEIPSLENADRNYGHLDYNELCGVFCVPFNSVGATHSDNKKYLQQP